MHVMKIRSARLSALEVVLLSIILATVEGCATRVGKPAADNDSAIVVAAAANLSRAFEELGRKFTARAGVRVTFSFGATGELAQQIENGAPFDVFASADVRHLDKLLRNGLIRNGSRALYARGRLVLWTPPASRLRLEQVEDLTAARVSKIALAKPDIAPYGEAAVEALRALNIWTEVERKIVYAQNVAQARQFASTGNADAAFIPRSLLREGEGSFIEINERLHRPIEQAMGIVSASKRQQAAERFTAFVLSEEGQSLLENFGYGRGAGAKP